MPTHDGRESRSSAAAEAEPDRIARARAGADLGVAGVSRGAALPADAQAWLTAVRNDLQRASRRQPRRRGRRTAAGRARARARDERGARQRRPDGSSIPTLSRRSRSIRCSRFASSRRRWPPDRSTRCSSSAAIRSTARRPICSSPTQMNKVRAARPLEPALERDVGDLALADSGGALSRGVERRARVRRHGFDRAAADRSSLRRPLRARSARGAERSPRIVAIADVGESAMRRESTRVRCAGLRRARRRLRNLLAAHRARRRDGDTALPARTIAAGSRLPRSARLRQRAERHRDCLPHRSRPSSTAASTTTAGCRSCRSRSPISRGTTPCS